MNRSYLLAAVVAVSSTELLLWQHRSQPTDIAAVLLASIGLGIAAALTAMLLGRILRPTVGTFLALVVALLPFANAFIPLLEFRTGLHAGTLGASLGLTLCLALLAASALTALLLRAAGRHLILAGALATSLAALAFQPRPPEIARPEAGPHPNILLVVLDTTRRDHMSVYGYPTPTTPSIERFVQDAQRYQDAWSVAPWTPSSHASMFTGLMPADHGVDGEAQPSFPPGIATLPEVLQTSGYRTAGFLANPNLLAPGWSRGFDTYRPPWIEGQHTLVNLLNRLIGGTQDPWRTERATPRTLELARRWWGESEERPRFLFINLLDPHRPYMPPEDMYEKLAPSAPISDALQVDQDPVTYHLKPGVSVRDAALLSALYDGEIAAMDSALGAFLDWLRARGDLDKTIIVITADHGERLGERGLVGHDLVMDQYLLQVPLIVRYPPQLSPGDVTERVQLDGVAGLVLNLAGLQGPEVMMRSAIGQQDRSVVVAQYGEPGWFFDRLLERDPSFDLSPYRGDWEFASDGEFAYVVNRGAPPTREWLTALHSDPEWQHNAASEHPEVIERLRAVAARLPAYHHAGSTPIDPSERERLRALGYVR